MAGKGGGIPRPVLAVVAFLLLARIFASMDSDLLEDFPFFAAVAAFVLFRVLSSRTGNQKRGPVPTPMPETTADQPPKDLGFKIPPLRGAPKTVQEEAQTQAQISDEDLDTLRRDSYERHLEEKKAREQKMEEERLRREHQKREVQAARPEAWNFSPGALRNAVILSEILAPPKALRRK